MKFVEDLEKADGRTKKALKSHVFDISHYLFYCVLLCFAMFSARDGRTGPNPDHLGRTDGQNELVKNNVLLYFNVFYYFSLYFTDKLQKNTVVLVFCYVLPIHPMNGLNKKTF